MPPRNGITGSYHTKSCMRQLSKRSAHGTKRNSDFESTAALDLAFAHLGYVIVSYFVIAAAPNVRRFSIDRRVKPGGDESGGSPPRRCPARRFSFVIAGPPRSGVNRQSMRQRRACGSSEWTAGSSPAVDEKKYSRRPTSLILPRCAGE